MKKKDYQEAKVSYTQMRTILNFRSGSCKIKLNMSLIYALKRSNLAAYIDVFVSLKTPEVALNLRANK